MEHSVCRRKCLEIIRCKQCHYCERKWNHQPLDLNFYCYNQDDYPKRTNPEEIPDWCPLEDWPDE